MAESAEATTEEASERMEDRSCAMAREARRLVLEINFIFYVGRGWFVVRLGRVSGACLYGSWAAVEEIVRGEVMGRRLANIKEVIDT